MIRFSGNFPASAVWRFVPQLFLGLPPLGGLFPSCFWSFRRLAVCSPAVFGASAVWRFVPQLFLGFPLLGGLFYAKFYYISFF